MNIQVRWNSACQCFECDSDDGASLAVQSHDVEHLLGRNFERDVDAALRRWRNGDDTAPVVAPLTDTDIAIVAGYAQQVMTGAFHAR